MNARRIARIWVAGLLPVWLFTLIHAIMTGDTPPYTERDWPTWAALGVWTVIVVAGDVIFLRRKGP